MPTPTDQFRQFDYDPGRGLGPLDSLASPSPTAVTSKTNADTRDKAKGVAVPKNAAPAAYAHRDTIREAAEVASVLGSAATPFLVTAGAVGGTSPAATVTLDWPDATGATSYKIEKSVDSGDWGAATPATSATSTSPQTGLSTGVTRFRVATVTPAGTAAPSVGIAVTVPAVAPTAPTTGAQVGAGPNASIPVTWGAVAGASYYKIERAADGTNYGPATPSTSPTNTSLQTGLGVGTTLKFRVAAVVNGVTSAYTPSAAGVTIT